MKKFILSLIITFQCFTFSSCGDEWTPMTCASLYMGAIKIDGKKGGKVSVQYIGPKEREYEKELYLDSSEMNAPFLKTFSPYTPCTSKSFKRYNYNFLKIKNVGKEEVYICSVINGPEIVEKEKEIKENFSQFYHLFKLYNKLDEDPTFDYTKSEYYKSIKYIDRYELYEKLLKEGYPYIIKLPPQKTCIMKWGGYGFKVI